MWKSPATFSTLAIFSAFWLYTLPFTWSPCTVLLSLESSLPTTFPAAIAPALTPPECGPGSWPLLDETADFCKKSTCGIQNRSMWIRLLNNEWAHWMAHGRRDYTKNAKHELKAAMTSTPHISPSIDTIAFGESRYTKQNSIWRVEMCRSKSVQKRAKCQEMCSVQCTKKSGRRPRFGSVCPQFALTRCAKIIISVEAWQELVSSYSLYSC